MPQYINPDTAHGVLAALNSRLTKLESFPPIGMTSLTTTQWNGTQESGYHPNELNWTDCTISYTQSLTFSRPTNVLAIAHASYFNDTNSGNGTLTWVRVMLTAAAATGPANDVKGVPMVSAPGAMSEQAFVGNATLAMCFTAPAGTYFGAMQYRMSANNGGEPQMAFAHLAQSEITLFRLSG